MEKIPDLHELFVEQLREQYDGERQLLLALQKLRESVTTESLHQFIDHHIGKTKTQMMRLDSIFSFLGRNLRGEVNLGVKGLVAEALGIVKRCTTSSVMDAGIIASIQRLNHYNMASYGTLHTYASELKMDEIKPLLKECLLEEKKMDSRLSDLAEYNVNLRAI